MICKHKKRKSSVNALWLCQHPGGGIFTHSTRWLSEHNHRRIVLDALTDGEDVDVEGKNVYLELSLFLQRFLCSPSLSESCWHLSSSDGWEKKKKLWQSYSWCRDEKFIVDASSAGSTERYLNGDTESHKRWVEGSWGTSEQKKLLFLQNVFLSFPILFESIILIAARDDCHWAEKAEQGCRCVRKLHKRFSIQKKKFLGHILCWRTYGNSNWLCNIWEAFSLLFICPPKLYPIHDRLRRMEQIKRKKKTKDAVFVFIPPPHELQVELEQF